MNIWAISDLHLGFSTCKPMDQFGEHWRDHHLKVEAAWRERVGERDIVLLPGDLTWALKPEEAREDLRWLAGLPGRKVLIKGNHDYWWPGSHAKLDQLLPPGVYGMKKRAVVIDGIPFVGVRGGDFLAQGETEPQEITANLAKERRELLQSIEHLDRTYSGPRPPIALFHYPPFRLDSRESAFTRILEDRGCKACVFGHLHRESEWRRVFQGEIHGVTYRLVSCDAIGFAPVLIEEDARG
jgi:hypothetical protein